MRTLIVTLLVVLTVGSTSHTQGWSGHYPNPPWFPTGYTASHLGDSNTPAPGDTIDGSEVFVGWAGYCYDGAEPSYFSATAVVHGQPVSVQFDGYTVGPRSDVTAYLQSQGCHGGNTVIVGTFPHGLPSGATAVSIKIHREATFAYHVFPVAH